MKINDKYPNAKKGKYAKRVVSRFNVSIPAEIIAELDEFCLLNGYKKNQIVDYMLAEFIEKWGVK